MLSLPLFIDPFSITILVIALIYLAVRKNTTTTNSINTPRTSKQKIGAAAADYGANRIIGTAKASMLGSLQLLLTVTKYIFPYIQRSSQYQYWKNILSSEKYTENQQAHHNTSASTSTSSINTPPTYESSFNDPTLPQSR